MFCTCHVFCKCHMLRTYMSHVTYMSRVMYLPRVSLYVLVDERNLVPALLNCVFCSSFILIRVHKCIPEQKSRHFDWVYFVNIKFKYLYIIANHVDKTQCIVSSNMPFVLNQLLSLCEYRHNIAFY